MPLPIHTFDQAAIHYDSVAILPQTVGEHLLNRLSLFQFDPTMILDVGCGTGHCLKILQKYYPKAQHVGLDCSQGMIQKAMGMKRWWEFSPSPDFIINDAQNLGFDSNQFDLICLNLVLPWIDDLKKFLSEMYRVLKPKGLLLLTTLGLDSFQELRQIVSKSEQWPPYPWAYCDMHLLGDELTQASFTEVVMDLEYFHLKYKNSTSWYQEMKQLGFNTLLPDIERDVSTLPINTATFEIIYGHAWKPNLIQKHSNQQEISISLSDLNLKTSSKT